MNIYFDRKHPSWPIYRIINALYSHPHPRIEAVEDPKMADLVLFHVTGRLNHIYKYIDEARASGKQYAIFQYALRSTRNPDPKEWATIWNGARVVWSYYDLPTRNLYRSPLGADPKLFHPAKLDKPYLVGTTGDTYNAECADDVFAAAEIAGGKVAHLGRGHEYRHNVDYYTGLYDSELYRFYGRCQWVSALRRKEGFELPAAEAALCGVRPIMFDTPDYRHWFDGLAEFIPENSNVVGSLVDIFNGKPGSLSDAQIADARARFDWAPIVAGFWERLL